VPAAGHLDRPEDVSTIEVERERASPTAQIDTAAVGDDSAVERALRQGQVSLPDLRTGPGIQSDRLTVESDGEHAVAGDGHRVTNRRLGLETPGLFARTRIDRGHTLHALVVVIPDADVDAFAVGHR
jgi:hypothetical protein